MENNPYKSVFNFYERITPPPKFATFVEGWQQLGKYVENMNHYVGAQLHKNLDPKGLYPYVNFATFEGTKEKILTDMTQPTPELINALIEGHGLPGHQINYPGGYTEMATDNNERLAPDLSEKTKSIFLIIAFQVLPDSAESPTYIEESWREHSHIQLLTDLTKKKGTKVGRYGFYKRFTPYEPFHSYMYVTRVELQGLYGTEPELWDAIKTINKMPLPPGIHARNASFYKVAEVSVGNFSNDHVF